MKRAMSAESKHTAGPWEISEVKTFDGTFMVVGGEGQAFGLIADVTMASDANLIAAGPDLLAALTLAEDVLSRFPYSAELWPNGEHPNAGIEQIRAALAKASPTLPAQQTDEAGS